MYKLPPHPSIPDIGFLYAWVIVDPIDSSKYGRDSSGTFLWVDGN